MKNIMKIVMFNFTIKLLFICTNRLLILLININIMLYHKIDFNTNITT